MKRILASILFTVLAMSPSACDMAEDDLINDFAADVFIDTSTSWAEPMIENLSGRGIVSGYSDGTFRPNRELTRAEMATLLAGSYPNCRMSSNRSNFSDVASDFWAAPHIDKVFRCGIMSGFPDGTFRPNDKLTRVQAIVAIVGALRGRHSAVDRAVKSVERLSEGSRASRLAGMYFDAVKIPSWASAAVIGATDAGMVIIGQDRLGVDTTKTRVLLPTENATRADVAAMLYGALNYPRGYDFGASPAPGAGGSFPVSPITDANLRDGEFVLTFDDGPRSSSVQVASLLRDRGITGLFFAVSKHLGHEDGAGIALKSAHHNNIKTILDLGHILGNHSHDHCIGGASVCGGKSFAQLSSSEARRQVELPHRIMTAFIASVGHIPRNKFLHFFRSPGGSWSSSAAEHVKRARLPDNYFGPIGWNLPPRGQEDFGCWSQGLSAAQCADRYLRAVDGGVRKGVILIHDNFDQAPELTRRIIDGLQARGKRFVHPRCIIGCTR